MVLDACNMAVERVEHLTNPSPRTVGSRARAKAARPLTRCRTGMQRSIREPRKLGWGGMRATDFSYPFCLRIREKGRQHGPLGISSKLDLHGHHGRRIDRVDRRAALPPQPAAGGLTRGFDDEPEA